MTADDAQTTFIFIPYSRSYHKNLQLDAASLILCQLTHNYEG